MIDLVYFTEDVRCYRDGRVEKFYGAHNAPRIKRGKWCEVENDPNHNGYNHVNIPGKQVLRHRMIAFCFHGLNIDDPTAQVDHISRDRIENIADNLRIVTHQQNHFNMGGKGCTWDKTRGKWRAQIKINGKTINLGRFDREEEAHQAYLDAKAIYHVI